MSGIEETAISPPLSALRTVDEIEAEKFANLRFGNLREKLNRDWVVAVLPMSIYTLLDGMGKYALNSDDPVVQAQLVSSAVTGFASLVSSFDVEGKRAIAVSSLTVFALAAGLTSGYSSLFQVQARNAAIAQQEQDRLKTLPQLNKNSQVPAAVLCDGKMPNGQAFPVTINGVEHTMTCHVK